MSRWRLRAGRSSERGSAGAAYYPPNGGRVCHFLFAPHPTKSWPRARADSAAIVMSPSLVRKTPWGAIGTHAPHRITAVHRFDLDDFGSEVCQRERTMWSRGSMGEVHDVHAGQGSCHLFPSFCSGVR